MEQYQKSIEHRSKKLRKSAGGALEVYWESIGKVLGKWWESSADVKWGEATENVRNSIGNHRKNILVNHQNWNCTGKGGGNQEMGKRSYSSEIVRILVVIPIPIMD